MLILIGGPNGSGKSRWAEQLACRLRAGRLLYVATMIPDGEAGRQRVERHRAQRQDLGFITLETPGPLAEVAAESSDTVLLEDVSNLLANALFAGNQPADAATVLADIRALAAGCAHLVAVTITGVTPEQGEGDETVAYIVALNWLNQELAAAADMVYELNQGRPLLLKGVAP